MKLLRTIAVTFALYSRIPMPHFEWKDEDMKYSISLFPWVGAVIAVFFAAVYKAAAALDLPAAAACLLMTAVPLIITGGFHVDGFMDVSDALSSYRTREEKLEILKDPHIGAFAVIRLCITGLIFTAALIMILNAEHAADLMYITAAGFFIARAFSALAVLTFRSARNEGMLFYESSCAGQKRNANLALCALWLTASAGLVIFIDMTAGITAVASAAAVFGWYRYKSYKEFGGITGDTAGWFVTVCETAIAAAVAAASLLA